MPSLAPAFPPLPAPPSSSRASLPRPHEPHIPPHFPTSLASPPLTSPLLQSPAFLPVCGSSLRNFVILESPLYANMPVLMGMTRFDSDDDDESDMNHIYSFTWRPQARLSSLDAPARLT